MIDPRLEHVLESLTDRGLEEVEVFSKTGRSRSHRWEATSGAGRSSASDVSSLRHEAGWAVRAGDARRSFFFTASGAPDPASPWPEADGRGLRLPSPRPIPPWTPPSDLETPLVGEAEARAVFDAVARELDAELPGARLLRGWLDDGASRQTVVSSRGVLAESHHRAASIVLEAVGRRPELGSCTLSAFEREARTLGPRALAHRLADRVLIAERGTTPRRDRGEVLLAPEVATRLLAALAPAWLGAGADERAAALADRAGHFASRHVTLVDDGRLVGGLLAAPCDGEGLPTRRVVLVEDGVFRQPLVHWSDGGARRAAGGTARRSSWRDLPHLGPSHLHLRPDPRTAVGEMLADVSRGFYLLSTDGAPRLDDAFTRFALPVSGFAIDSGRASGMVARCWLAGTIAGFLQGILGVGRDLTFTPLAGGMIGSPTLLVRGLELRDRP